MTNPYLDRVKRNLNVAGTTAEKKSAKRMSARLQPASGAIEGAKGDFSLENFLIESKSTCHNSLSIQFEWLSKISREAMAIGKSPALSISYTTESGKKLRTGAWVAIPEDVFLEMIESYNEVRKKGVS